MLSKCFDKIVISKLLSKAIHEGVKCRDLSRIRTLITDLALQCSTN